MLWSDIISICFHFISLWSFELLRWCTLELSNILMSMPEKWKPNRCTYSIKYSNAYSTLKEFVYKIFVCSVCVKMDWGVFSWLCDLWHKSVLMEYTSHLLKFLVSKVFRLVNMFYRISFAFLKKTWKTYLLKHQSFARGMYVN